jgi:hypothetical protein
MTRRPGLSLPELVLLLALDDESGTIAMGSLYGYALGGAVVAELALDGRIAVERVKKSDLITVVDDRSTGDPVLDDALMKMAQARRPSSVTTWVGRLAQSKMRDALADRLVTRGILRRAEGRVLLIFARRTWPTMDERAERDAIEHMGKAIFHDEEPDERTAILIGLAHPAGLLTNVFEKKELKQRKDRIRQIIELSAEGSASGKAVSSAIQTAMAAVTAATVVVTAS